MQLITLHTAFNPADADLVKSQLEAAGFHPFLKNDIAALSLEGYGLTAGGILVQVPETEAAEAKAFLEAPPAPSE